MLLVCNTNHQKEVDVKICGCHATSDQNPLHVPCWLPATWTFVQFSKVWFSGRFSFQAPLGASDIPALGENALRGYVGCSGSIDWPEPLVIGWQAVAGGFHVQGS